MKHIAIIMDGNRRFAKSLGMSNFFGHKKGVEAIKTACKCAKNQGVQFLTLFAFSKENWKREEDEIKSLNILLNSFLDQESKNFLINKIKVCIIGDVSVYNKETQKKIFDLEEKTKNFKDFTLSIALNYGGREDILNAVNKALKQNITELSQDNFEKYLQTGSLPEVDLLIRTGGFKRLSNFILWRITYAELYFTDILWPEFNELEFEKAISFFKAQKRNFGK